MGRVCNDDAFYMWWIQVPIKTMLIDGNCRVEDRGLKTHHGHVSLIFTLILLLLEALLDVCVMFAMLLCFGIATIIIFSSLPIFELSVMV